MKQRKSSTLMQKKREKIYRGITYIDDDILMEAESSKETAPPVRKSERTASFRPGSVLAAAACLCLLLTAAFLLPRMSGQQDIEGDDPPSGLTAQNTPDPSGEEGVPVSLAGISHRPVLIDAVVQESEIDVTPQVEPYQAEADLSNITNLQQFYPSEIEGLETLLSQNGFAVSGYAGGEFFGIYEENRYAQVPSFVTVDSLMHTYHLYFAYLLRKTEQDHLSESLSRLSRLMLEDSAAQYEALKDSEWAEAARRNVAFFTVGASLLDDTVPVQDYVAETVQYELDAINGAESILTSEITGGYEDYTQYIPRGYYAGNEQLEKYFKAMMWYGRIHFTQEDESLDRSAFLMTLALSENGEAYRLWESLYAVTSFFAGASDDLIVSDYAPAIRAAYGDTVALADLPGDTEAFEAFHSLTGELPLPVINSIPIDSGTDNVIPGFRFMGQRFSVDAAVMQKLIYSDIEENSAGDRRMLPDVLDLPAALGSDTALSILEEAGATDYSGYTEAMEQLRAGLSQENETLWSASLYASWLNTLRPLLTEKGEGYPSFMQNREWTKKSLECFSGSFAELKHDTVLYSKQAIAEMGGFWDETIDDRGYVEPEPLVYARFASLAEQTAQGLKRYGILAPEDEENLSRLSQMADYLLTISCKELEEETLTEEEYEFIRNYGGNLEHFWYDAAIGLSDFSAWEEGAEGPARQTPIVIDIATDPSSGQVLEIATGRPEQIYVVIRVDGVIKLARGSVYSFYQFSHPAADRLTDAKWRRMTGVEPDEDGNFIDENPVDRPQWTTGYRYE